MLHFILGKSGSGKTARAVDIITELHNKGERKLLFLVPDQSSFETETTFFHKLGAKDCRDVLVFGFTRLCNYVFTNTGNVPQNVIDDGVRKILMSKALDEVVDRLGIFSGKRKRKSVLDLMLHSLKECSKDHITPDMLRDVSEHIDSDVLRHKLGETSLILDAYYALLGKSYIDPLENLDRLRDILSDSELFSGYTIVVDSFSGFTYQQLDVIEILMKRSKDFYVTINIDAEYKNYELFRTTNRTRSLIKRIAKSNSVEIDKDVVLSEFKRSDKPEISFIENNLFRLNNNQYSKSTENITTFIADNIYSEASFVARRIKSLIVDEGYSYGDIAVVCRSLDKYDGILDTVFEKFDIPYYMNVTRDIFTTPIVRFISSAIDAVTQGFDREQILSMLKSGAADFSETETAELENYLYIWNLDRSDLKKPFRENPSGFEKLTDSDKENLARLENLRQRVVEPLIKFSETAKDGDALTVSKALYTLLGDYNIEQAIDNYYDKLEAQGMTAEADEAIRAYNSVMEALDKLVSVAGSKPISLKTYREYFDYLVSDIQLGEIPRYQDQVNVATADRARLSGEKVVFIIGAIDGEFPSVPKTAGAFTESERKILIENSIPLTDTLDELSAHEKYLVYCALTSASDKIFVSTYLSDFSGNTYQPSEIFAEIERMFPKKRSFTSADTDEADELYNKQQAFEYLARKYLSGTKEASTLKAYFERDSFYSSFVSKLDKAVSRIPFKISDSSVSEKLFKKDMNISASQIEVYNKCAFRYFCQYGLRARERRKASIDAIQFGNIVHFVLEMFLKKYNKQAVNNLDAKDIRQSIDEIMLSYADETFGGLDDKSDSFKNLFERLKINIFALVKQIIRQLGYSDFIPCDFELHIGGEIPAYKVELENGRSVSVNGYIDRVDKLEKDNETYIRIVDYKTGNKEFKLYEILYGINLQMLIYLRAVAQGGAEYYNSNIIPAGVLYMPSAVKEIDGDECRTEEKINSKLDSNLRMNGLVLSDNDVLEHMDRSGKFIKKGRIQDGEYSNSLASGEQFVMIFEHIDKVISQMSLNLHDGNIEAEPIKGAVDGCAFCPYDSVCLHTYDDDYRYRSISDPKEVYDKLKEEGEGV